MQSFVCNLETENYTVMKQLLFVLILLFSASVYSQTTPSVMWFYDVNDMSFGNSATADIDGDDTLEIVFSTYRNDCSVYALNAEDGSLLWKYNTGGCNDVAPLIYDVDQDGQLEVVVPGSCNPTTFCFDGATGIVEWSAPTRGSDSPPTVADIDNDGKPEILHGEFGGYVICLNGEDGSQAWEIPVDLNSWIQTAPTILDVDQDNQLDFVVANWNFDSAHAIFAYRGDTQTLIWQDTLPDDVMYHGASHADLDQDQKPELVIGSYDGSVYCFNAEDGSLNWQFTFPSPWYVGAPTSIADLNNDGHLEIVFVDWFHIGVLSDSGTLIWDYNIPDYANAFRGVAISDIDGDDTLDIAFGTSKGMAIALKGSSGDTIWTYDLEAHYGQTFEIDHGPIIADFDNDGKLDMFLVGGHAEYPNIQNNYGRGYALRIGDGFGPAWPMFRRDVRRTACVCPDTTSGVIQLYPDTFEARVLPNPSDGSFEIRFLNPENKNVTLHIFSMTGRLIYSNNSVFNTFTLHETELPQGIYLFRLMTDENKIASGKLIIR